ncbi:MAG: transglutaminase family protein [Verrucomicrobia bacterium]|nr:transglutaminase family protein [Verrucomicrobiota bacterium]
MRVQISNTMRYRYARAVSFSPQIVRLFPRADQAIVTRRLQTDVNVPADVQYRHDLFDNLVAKCVLRSPESFLELSVRLEVEISPKNPFHFLLAGYAVELPFDYEPDEREVLAAFRGIRPEDEADTDQIWSLRGKAGTVETLLDVVSTLRREITYEARLEGAAKPPREVLKLRSGACRDTALLCALLLRKLGLAVRVVSGFFCEFEVDVPGRRAERGLHAWVEVYLPGAGWVGLDPTNGLFCDERFIPTAVGIKMADVAPIEGNYYDKERVHCDFDAQLDIQLVTEPSLEKLAQRVEASLTGAGIQLTLGGEPTFIPLDPQGAEWAYAAVGPEKLAYAYRFADALTEKLWPEALVLYTPGKLYPGEVNPRWAINVIRPDRTIPHTAKHPGQPPHRPAALESKEVERFCDKIATALGVREPWLPALDPRAERQSPPVWVLPLDHSGEAWVSERWDVSGVPLTLAEGPAGLRIAWSDLPEGTTRRALVIEPQDEGLAAFLPPLLAEPFAALVETIAAAASRPLQWQGYLPPDLPPSWPVVAFAADPGVLEVNLPPCQTWLEYRQWLQQLQDIAAGLGLTTTRSGPVPAGTGGGNHLLFGGPTLDANPFFARAGWLASILRYWQHHPALAYLFTGHYVGPSSQAPRPDESAKHLLDLELACRQLEALESGDRRQEIQELLRHLHTDLGGNTHRSELSFDKFWSHPSGARGLLEFRALESLPHPEWSAAVALLWRAIFAYLHERPFRWTLEDWGDRLHDRYLLPSFLWRDLTRILTDLAQFGVAFDPGVFRDVWQWRFPPQVTSGPLCARRALEAWPLLSETPEVGGTTSRFVDSSMERWEVVADAAWVTEHALYVNNREITFRELDSREMIAGFRFRKSSLYPSLHARLPVQLPIQLLLQSREDGRIRAAWRYDGSTTQQCAPEEVAFEPGPPAEAATPGAYTYDLRIAQSLFG